jgi:surfeit locus 1 family protein
MRLRVGDRVFAPRVWAALLSAAALAVCVSLGWWQIGRAREKQALIDAFARGTRSSVQLTADLRVDTLPRYQHVRVLGHYEPARQVLLDNMPSHDGQPGYRVLTPFRRQGAARALLLVDRGWVPLGVSRAVQPNVQVGSEFRAVAGRLDGLPEPGVRVGTAGVAGDTHWPRVLNFPRPADVEQALGVRVESRILLLDPAAPDGFERVWRPSLGFGPERHLGYAIQWFALALVVIVAFVALSIQRIEAIPSPGSESPQ